MGRLRTHNRRALRKQPRLRIRIIGLPPGPANRNPIYRHLRWDIQIERMRKHIATLPNYGIRGKTLKEMQDEQ